MVDMGMGQQDGSNRFWIEAQVTILTKRLLSAPLKEPAIQQQPTSGRFNHVATSGDGSGRAVKGELHDGVTPW
jgi:hypothetical protein